MSTALPSSHPIVLADLVPAQAFRGALVRDAVLVGGAAGFVGLAAQLSIPIAGSPVPVTGQTFAVLLAGTALGAWRGLAAMALYLAAGAAGMPWFAEGTSGTGMPTFGYLVGFLGAAALAGALARRGADRGALRTAGVMLLGNAVIYAAGVSYLAHDLGISLSKAYDIGMRDYLLGDALKIALAMGLLPTAWKVVDRVRGPRG
ncbi:biotin transporter BioY [Yinghuangia seranimata]|uniref:biotin transporter BioY n=1 Tax=Yinghuangia seranimata TaxID=408067 RepID=UPI00248C8C85|nr:biotin transporter BioY [Yinghuangia seranimata]MDI2127355.1 biotin transporter BioY [Yinghuangia seranimata]